MKGKYYFVTHLAAFLILGTLIQPIKLVNHFSRIWRNPFYVYFKKHYCPKCSTVLKTTTESKIVNSESPEAKDYDFHNVDNYMIGDVKFIYDVFLCSNCGRVYTVEEMKKIEQGKERNE